MPAQKRFHVGVFGSEIACYHCGERAEFIPKGGLPVSEFLNRSRAFERVHHRCVETDESPTRKLEPSVEAWERGLFVGTSSGTIFAIMMGRPPVLLAGQRMGSIPADPDDFSRCHRLLRVKPEWRDRLPEVAARYPAWGPLVANWDMLTELYEARAEGMYDFMRSLRPAKAS